MARSRKRRRRPTRRGLIRGSVRFFTLLFPYIFCAGILALLFGSSYAFAVQSDLFALRNTRVENGRAITGTEAFLFTGLRRGQPLLPLDLRQVEHNIRRRYPEYSDVRVRRVLPSGIHITVKHRDPVAQIRLDRFYHVDADGLVVAGGFAEAHRRLPHVKGLRIPRTELEVGQRLDRRWMGNALRLLVQARRLAGLKAHDLTALEVVDRRNYLLWIDDRIEVRLSARDFAAQLKKLAEVLEGIELDARKIRYIDLRFDDVVIGPR